MRRVLIGVSVAVAALLVAGAVFGFVSVRRSFPDTTGEVRLDGVSGPIDIVRDASGVPQVYADTPEDLFFGQGYVQAQDRFWEMDFRRHVTAGRLSELIGESALDADKLTRTLGWRRVAEQEVQMVDAGTRRLLGAYSRGVNSYIDGKSGASLSLEYAVLSLAGTDRRPEPWTPADSVAWLKAIAWDLRSNMSDEIARSASTQQLTAEQVEDLYPDGPAGLPTTVDDADVAGDEMSSGPPPGTDVAPARAAVAALGVARRGSAALPDLLGTGDGIGSNAWVVSGEKSATGRPLLANDPHLEPSMPGVWYQVGLHCRTVSQECPYDVSGFSFAGLPGVIIGHNRDVAWGVTAMYADATDLALERVSGDRYEYDGRQLPLLERRETFEVARGETETITVRSTRNGPLLSDLDEDIGRVGRAEQTTTALGSYEVALKWTALTPEPTIEAMFALGRASDWEEFRAATEKFSEPALNFVYADVEGNIGYQAPGSIPVRRSGDGRWPVPGWDPAYQWDGLIPFDELPSVLNPDDGFIVSANNQVIGEEYPRLLGADMVPGYRAARIRDVLERDEPTDVDDMTRLQLDASNPNAERLVPALLDVDLGDSSYYSAGQRLLRDWDLQQTADSGAAAYFNAVWRRLLELTFHDQLPVGFRPDGGERWFAVVNTFIDDARSPWWDDVDTPDRLDTREDVLRTAMRRARDDMTRLQARDPAEWTWGRLHRMDLVNETLGQSGIGVIEAQFNRGPFDVAGGGGLVDASGWDAAQGFEVTSVPTMRMVVDLADLDRSRWIQLTGNSGHAHHPNYVDQLPVWQRGETLPWAFSRRAVAASAEDTLRLRPTAGG